jgi:hypothetical protein
MFALGLPFLVVLHLATTHFHDLLERLANAWNEGDARGAAECFTGDALYL